MRFSDHFRRSKNAQVEYPTLSSRQHGFLHRESLSPPPSQYRSELSASPPPSRTQSESLASQPSSQGRQSETPATQSPTRQRSEAGVDDIDNMLNGLTFTPDNYVVFRDGFVNNGSDTNFVNGHGELLLPSGRRFDLVVRPRENRRHNQPSHRIYEVNESKRARDIGILWWNQSRKGEWYFSIDIKDQGNPFKGFLWPYEGSNTTWEIVKETKRAEVSRGPYASP